MDESSGIIEAPELAKLMGKSRATVWRWARNGQIPAAAVVWFGRVARFRKDVLVTLGLITEPQPAEVCDVG